MAMKSNTMKEIESKITSMKATYRKIISKTAKQKSVAAKRKQSGEMAASVIWRRKRAAKINGWRGEISKSKHLSAISVKAKKNNRKHRGGINNVAVESNQLASAAAAKTVAAS
jgi:hypothetical protein